MRIQSCSRPRLGRPGRRVARSLSLRSCPLGSTPRKLAHTRGWLTFVAIITQSLCAFGSANAQCIDYANLPHWVGGTKTSGLALAIAGDYAYVADGARGLLVIDIAQPRPPKIVGSVDTPGEAMGVAVSGNFAYVADGDGRSGLLVIDVTDPQIPRIVGSVATPGGARRVAVSGSNAYVAGWFYFHVIDITNPWSPQVLGTAEGMPSCATGIAISGTYAFVSGWGQDFR